MWIRSQDNRLFNLDRVECIYVETRLFDYMSLETSQIEGHTKEFYIRALSSRDDELGTYATEKRCIEVLNDIHKHIENSGTVMYEYLHSESSKIEYTYKQLVVYSMPKE